MAKRIQALVLAVLMLTGIVWGTARPAHAATVSGSCGDALYWELEDGILYIFGQGDMDTDADYQPWAEYAEQIVGIFLEEGVTSIGDYAFNDCEALVYVELAESVETIGDYAFGTAYDLEEIDIPKNVTHIGRNAMPLGVRRINVAKGNRWYCSVDGVLFNKDQTTLINYPTGKEDAAYSVPSSVTKIELWAFDASDYLESLYIPAGVSSLGEEIRYEFDTGALFWYSSISHIDVARENRWYSAVDGVLFDKSQTMLLRYPELKPGWNYTVPEGVTSIGAYAFHYCTELEHVTLPQSVQSIGESAFSCCFALETMTLSGGMHAVEAYAFEDCESLRNVWYPGTREAWNAVTVLQGNEYLTDALEFGNQPIEEPEQVPGGPLTSLDYLAFSHIVYKDLEPYKGQTVRQILEDMGLWSAAWEDREMLYREVYGNIADWKLFYVWDYSLGFYAAAFDNLQGEVVITYRGSEPIGGSSPGNEIWKDWVMSDLEMLLNGNDTQVYCALLSYQTVKDMCPDDRITITGHSLGGALGDIVSAYSGDYAETFNAAPFLDIAYFYYADRMGADFAGTNAWNFRDHVNGGDTLVGAAHLEYKPHYLHEDSLPWGEKGFVMGQHALKSFIYKTENGDIAFTNYVEDSRVDSMWSMAIPDIEDISKEILQWAIKPHSSTAWLLVKIAGEIDFGAVYLGTDGKDTIRTEVQETQMSVVFGGDGDDRLLGLEGGEMFIGGAGQDWLDGSYGDDSYLYYKGDGEDYIWDAFGTDTIFLMDFETADEIVIEEWDDRICIWYQEDVILHINKNRSAPRTNAVALVVGEEEIDLTPYFYGQNFCTRYVISCPVSLEIVEEATGETAQYIDGSVEEAYHTDYGIFYVYEDENGDFVKVADMVEGYTLRILGDDTGTMDVLVRKTDGVTLSEAFAVKNVAVRKGMVATVTQSKDQTFCLEVDRDGDGKAEETLQMTEDTADSGEEPEKPEGILPWGKPDSLGKAIPWDKLAICAGAVAVLVGGVCLLVKRKNKKNPQE